jgi:hypothetical protein
MSRVTKHFCANLAKEAINYKKEFARDHPPSVERGAFGLGVHGFAEHPQLYPHPEYGQEKVIYIPFATHCPYCGEEIPPWVEGDDS